MQADPGAFFPIDQGGKVVEELSLFLEDLLRPSFGDDWAQIAKSKAYAEQLSKLVRETSSVSRDAMLADLKCTWDDRLVAHNWDPIVKLRPSAATSVDFPSNSTLRIGLRLNRASSAWAHMPTKTAQVVLQ